MKIVTKNRAGADVTVSSYENANYDELYRAACSGCSDAVPTPGLTMPSLAATKQWAAQHAARCAFKAS